MNTIIDSLKHYYYVSSKRHVVGVAVVVGVTSAFILHTSVIQTAHAQMMMRGTMMGVTATGTAWTDIVTHTEEAEAAGRLIYEELIAETRSCESLTKEDFEHLGEYFMGEMTGESHAAMNAMLMRMHGEEGEEAMHAELGSRMSGCEWEGDGASFLDGTSMGMMGGMMGMGGSRQTDSWGYGQERGDVWRGMNAPMMPMQGGWGYGGYGVGFPNFNNMLTSVLLIIGILIGIKWLRSPLPHFVHDTRGVPRSGTRQDE